MRSFCRLHTLLSITLLTLIYPLSYGTTSTLADSPMPTPPPTIPLIDVASLCSELNIIPTIEVNLKYAGTDNFMGRVIRGYQPAAHDLALLTHDAALALCNIQKNLIKQGLGLRVFEAYRPKQALQYMSAWANDQQPLSNHEFNRKKLHYPHLNKTDLFPQGYIADDSQHCYGYAVDVTLVDLHKLDPRDKKAIALDMGTIFDFMDPLSHPSTTEISGTAQANRQRLARAMLSSGFHPYDKEWWHFSYRTREVTQPLDIPITTALRGIGIPVAKEKR